MALARFGCCCAAGLASLLLASRVGLGSWGFLRVYAAWLSAADTQPNCGAWWYLLAEAFPPQRGTLVAAMHLLPRVGLLPLALRLRRRPLLATCLCAGLLPSFQPYPSAPCLCFSPAHRHAASSGRRRRRSASGSKPTRGSRCIAATSVPRCGGKASTSRYHHAPQLGCVSAAESHAA